MDFEAYVQARGGALLRFCCVLCDRKQDAEDLLQEALARCYLRWGRISAMDNIDGYVQAVCVSRFYSHNRRRRVRTQPLEGANEPIVGDPASAVIWQQTLRAALRALPPRQRAVIALTYYLDQPDTAIAGQLHCSVNTVKSHRAKALESLRRFLPDADRIEADRRDQ